MANSAHPSIVRHESVLLWVCPPKNREKYLASVILGHRRRAVIPGQTTSWTPWWVLHRIITLSETEQSQLPRMIQYRHRNCCWGFTIPSLFLAGNISHRACLNSFCRSWSTNKLERICHNIKKAFWIVCVRMCVKNNRVVERNSRITRDTLRISLVMNDDWISIQFDTSKNPKQQRSIWGWWQ